MKKIEFENLMTFGVAITLLREDFPEFAKEIDRCAFDVGQNYQQKCGDANCLCETLTFEEFHIQRNICFGTTARAKG